MSEEGAARTGGDADQKLAGAVSELNNLLQIITGTTALMENIWQGRPAADKYFEMLRTSVGRASSVTAQLISHAKGLDEKVIVHPAARERMVRSRPWHANPQLTVAPKKRILVVDDEPMAVEIASKILMLEGFEVRTARNGFECLNVFSAAPGDYDLITLDLAMPFMDGEEVFDRLRGIKPDARVLLSTGYVDGSRLDRMTKKGLNGVLTKPCLPSEFVEKVRFLVEAPLQPPDGTVAAM